MKTLPESTGTLHFVGIGGIGMSGIAEVLLTLGYKVQGSDISENGNVVRLREKGAIIHIGHNEKNIYEADGSNPCAVIISSAIKPENPELIEARNKRIPVVRRAEMLAELMRLKWAVAIAGTHGKTTTTSMVGALLEQGNLDPTVINGGIVNAYGTNTRIGNSDWMVVEADESDGTFTRLPAAIGIVTNIDPEHMEHYGSVENIRKSFRQFIDNIPFYGFAVMCIDHPEVQSLIAEITDRKVISYGTNPQADVQAINIRTVNGKSVYDIRVDGKLAGTGNGEDVIHENVELPMLGMHNILNSLAATSVALQLNIDMKDIKEALKNFSGVKRRFTCTGVIEGVNFIDDYGHHPVEIKAVLKAGRMAVEETGGQIIAVMQPHRYSRLSSLFDEFCKCFNDADSIYIADVYPAGEAPIEGYNKETLVEGIIRSGHRDAATITSVDDLTPILSERAKSGDYVIFLGAGDITKWANAMPAKYEEAIEAYKRKAS